MVTPKVSIIVPIYNGEKYIDNCVKNIKAQTYENLEFILVDDGNTDGSGDKCDRYAEEDSRIKVIHQRNQGVSVARNTGTSAASGEYILYYDVDDDILPNTVEDNIKLAIKNDADVVIFGFYYYNVDSNVRTDNILGRGFVGSNKEFFNEFLVRAIDHEILNPPWNKLYKRSFLRDNGITFLPESPIYEDAAFTSLMLQYAKKIVVNDGMYYKYNLRSTGTLITRYVDEYFDSVTKYYDFSMGYCEMYDDNARQIQSFSNVYVSLVTTNLKQISCNENIKFRDKIKLISNICKNPKFRSALHLANISPRRRFVKYFALTKNAVAVYIMYKFLGEFQ